MLFSLWGVSARQMICLYPEAESCREIGQSFEKCLRRGKHAKNFEYFEWIFKQLLHLYDVKNYADLGGYWLTINDSSSVTKERIETYQWIPIRPIKKSLIPSTDVIPLNMILKMTRTEQVVKTTVTANNSPIRDPPTYWIIILLTIFMYPFLVS